MLILYFIERFSVIRNWNKIDQFPINLIKLTFLLLQWQWCQFFMIIIVWRSHSKGKRSLSHLSRTRYFCNVSPWTSTWWCLRYPVFWLIDVSGCRKTGGDRKVTSLSKVYEKQLKKSFWCFNNETGQLLLDLGKAKRVRLSSLLVTLTRMDCCQLAKWWLFYEAWTSLASQEN